MQRLAGPWHLGERRGSGGFGVVWVAQRTEATDQFAIKVLDPAELKVDIPFEEARRRFRREVETQTRLQPHPNVMPILDFDLDAEHPWFRMPLAQAPLATLIGVEPPLGDDQVASIFLGIAAGVGHAHENGVVHRDLKPDNVLFLPGDANPKVSDFGLVIDEWSTSTRRTRVGMGTLYYSAPEVFDDPLNVDRRADIFSLARILQDLLSGVASPRSINPRLPSKYRALVARATAEDRDERYVSVEALTEAFSSIRVGIAQAEVAEERYEEELRTWRLAKNPSERAEIVRRLASLFERHLDNERFMLDAVPRLPIDLVAAWAKQQSRSFEDVVLRFDTHVGRLPLTGFDFGYLDEIADFYQNAFAVVESPQAKRQLVTRLLWAGLRWDEVDIGRALAAIIGAVADSDAMVVSETLREHPLEAVWVQPYTERVAVSPVIRRVFEQVAAQPLRVDDLSEIRNLASARNLQEHVADGQTIRLANYPSAVLADEWDENADGTGSTPQKRTVEFAPSVRGTHFDIQQGLYATTIEIALSDGRRFEYEAAPVFYPDRTSFGLLCPVDLASVALRNERGNFEVSTRRFWATRDHKRVLRSAD